MKLTVDLRGHGHVQLDVRRHDDSALLRLAPWTKRATVTLDGVIYLADELWPWFQRDARSVGDTLAHEYVHVLQQSRLGWPLFALLYTWFPLVLALLPPLWPLSWLAPWRVAFECEAYAHEIVHYGRDFDACVSALCSGLYGWPAPRWLVRKLMRECVDDARARS
jgi:hypothetical protein